MAKRSRRGNSEGSNVDMTPMIDVVFQLIIFFIVTITISDTKNEDILLEMGEHGQEIETGESNVSSLIIEVDRKGRMSIGNATIDQRKLQEIVSRRFKKMGNTFQVWIRGDVDARHDMVRKAMDICTACGIGRVSFVAIKEVKTEETRKRQRARAGRRRR